MATNSVFPGERAHPMAIFDKDLVGTSSFRIELFELCTLCGARFGIGYLEVSKDDPRTAAELEELPQKLIEVLAKDHRQDRKHRHVIDLDP